MPAAKFLFCCCSDSPVVVHTMHVDTNKPEGARHVINRIPHGLLQGGEEGSSQPGSPNKAAGSSGAAGQGEEEGEQLTLDQLDSEIANVDAELRVRAAATLHRFTVPASNTQLWSA